ncbi:MAG: phosphatase PAP2 family protein [Betaproteobacteria bacterium]|nr:MAG: phosphatase PAP2 family protein [Betaproteobacteria bacterium]
MVVAAALATGCATVTLPTSPAELSDGRRGYVSGYLQPTPPPDGVALLPPPPAAGSAAFAADAEAYRATRKLRGSPRWLLAAKDADLSFPNAAETFSCALGMPVSEQATPHLNILLLRSLADASRTSQGPKKHYKRRRPFAFFGDASCTPLEKSSDDSFPSSHATIGWAWALVLAEIAPDRADDILVRGLAFGQSRVICGMHWQSDVEAGRLLGAALVSRLHANPVFSAQLAAARREIESARSAGAKSPQDCTAEAQVLGR